MSIKTERTYDSPARVNAGPIALVCAVIQAGVEDAMRGDESARKWIDSRDFGHWCEWANLDPDYMRGRIVPMLPKLEPELLLPTPFHPGRHRADRPYAARRYVLVGNRTGVQSQ